MYFNKFLPDNLRIDCCPKCKKTNITHIDHAYYQTHVIRCNDCGYASKAYKYLALAMKDFIKGDKK